MPSSAAPRSVGPMSVRIAPAAVQASIRVVMAAWAGIDVSEVVVRPTVQG